MSSSAQLLVAVLGRGIVGADEPVAFADDFGLTRGDGCFEATRVCTGPDGVSNVEHLDRHLERLQGSASRLAIAAPADHLWQEAVQELLGQWHTPGEAVLKLVLTRGRDFGPAAPPYGQVLLAPLDAASLRERDGIDVLALNRGHPLGTFADAPWLLGGVKSLSYAVHLAARREAMARGAQDALFVTTDGYALEGPTSALVWAHGGALFTTRHGDTGVLASITSAVLFEAVAAEGMTCGYDVILAADLTATDGAWLLSSVRGVAPIRRLDGHELAFDPALSARVTHLAGF